MSEWNWFRKVQIAPGYMNRWCLLAWRDGRRLYLHHTYGSDWSRDPHDHPKEFRSLGLAGGYVEEWYNRDAERLETRQYRAPFYRRFPATHIHRLRVGRRGCWTLVLTGPVTRTWGFWLFGSRTIGPHVSSEWIPSHLYIEVNYYERLAKTMGIPAHLLRQDETVKPV